MRETDMIVFDVDYSFHDEIGRVQVAHKNFVATSFDEVVRNIRFHYKGGKVLSVTRLMDATHIKAQRKTANKI